MKIIDIKDRQSIEKSVKIFRQSGILIFPTDTVYGIGCLPNLRAIKKLYQIKKRPQNMPTAILYSQEVIKKDFNFLGLRVKSRIKKFYQIIKNYQPGKITVIIDAGLLNKKFPGKILKNGKIGIRITSSSWLENLINKVGPIVASSANQHQGPTPVKFEDIDRSILNKVDLIIRDVNKRRGKPSIVYDLEKDLFIRQ